jgi:hypothetical protein
MLASSRMTRSEAHRDRVEEASSPVTAEPAEVRVQPRRLCCELTESRAALRCEVRVQFAALQAQHLAYHEEIMRALDRLEERWNLPSSRRPKPNKPASSD